MTDMIYGYPRYSDRGLRRDFEGTIKDRVTEGEIHCLRLLSEARKSKSEPAVKPAFVKTDGSLPITCRT